MKIFKRIIIVMVLLIVFAFAAMLTFLNLYKKEISALLIDNLKTNYALVLKMEDVDISIFSEFPTASIRLKKISLTSQLHSKNEEAFLSASSLHLNLNLKKLLSKQFSIQSVAIDGAKINLIRSVDGTKNFEFKHPIIDTLGDSNKTSNLTYEISKLKITNSQFSFINAQRKQHISIFFIDNNLTLNNTLNGIETHLTGEVLIGGLLFKPTKGPFLSNARVNLNFYASILKSENAVFIHQPSYIVIENQKYDVNSYLTLDEEKKLVLKIIAKNINSKKTISLLNTNIQKSLSKIHVDKPIDADVLIIVNLGVKEDPIVLLNIKGDNNDVTIGTSKLKYSNVAFSGSLICLDSTLKSADMKDANLNFTILKGNVYDVDISGTIKIHNLEDPFIKISANLNVDGKKLNLKPSKDFILNGKAVAKVDYSGPIDKLNDDEFLSPPMVLKAAIDFNDFSYRDPNSVHSYIVKGKASLTNRELIFNNLQLKMTGGNVLLTGKVDDFAQYALGFKNGFKADLLATTDAFNLTPYTQQQNGKPNKPKTTAQKKQNQVIIGNTIQTVEESSFEFNVVLNAKKFFLRKVQAYNTKVDLTYKKQLLTLKSISMNTCGGVLNASGTIQNLNKVNINVAVKKLDITQVMKQFENFGQKAIESKNLTGLISLNANFKTDLDDKMEIVPSSMEGNVKLKLEKGHLIDYEPLQNISNYIFRNRDFQDIQFTELNETFKLNGYEMQIDELEIGSNVLNLFVTGRYNFIKESNINLLIPWSNLRRRGKNYIPKNSGQSAAESNGLKLNYSGMPKKMKLSLGHKTL